MKSELLDRFESGVARLIEEIESTRVRLKQAETEADGLRIHTADRDRLEGRVAELEEALAAASQNSPGLEARVAELMAAVEQKDARIAEVEGWLRDTAAHRDHVQEELRQANDRAEQHLRERDEAIANSEAGSDLRQENEDLRQRLHASVERENQTRRRLDALIKRIEETESILDSVEIAQHGNA